MNRLKRSYSKCEKGNIELKTINVDQIANEFAEIKNTMTVILFVACRNKNIEYKTEKLSLSAQGYNGISIVIYFSEAGLQT
jgi:hypothetical protein